MMRKIHYLYEIFSVSFGFALLAVFGTLSFFPIEIMFLGEEQTWFWTFVFLNYGVILAFLLYSFFNRESLKMMRIFDLGVTSCSILVIVAFLIYTRDMFEPWFVQGAWFLRQNGLIVGFFLGFVIIKTVIGTAFIISKFTKRKKKTKIMLNF